MKPSDASKPHLIITVGIPGSGKSFFAEHFAETFQAPIISFEQIRNSAFDHPTFSKEEDEIVNKITDHMLGQVLKTGRTIVYEGKTNQRIDRSNISKKAREAGYEPLFIWVQTDADTAKKRAIKPVAQKPSINSEQFDIKLKRFSAPHRDEKYIVISGKHTYASQLKIVLKNLVAPRTNTLEQPKQIRQPTNRSYLIR